MNPDDLLKARIQNTFRQNPPLAARWVMLRDHLTYAERSRGEKMFWTFIAREFAPAFKKIYGHLPLADYDRIREQLVLLANWQAEAAMAVRPFGQKPDDALIRDDIVIIRWSEDSYVVAYFKPNEPRKLHGIEYDTQEEAMKAAVFISRQMKKDVVYITRKNQRRTLLVAKR